MSERNVDRRGRQRQATLMEIHGTARRLLVAQGSAAVTINAVAREMGISGPALYHYYPSHEGLVGAVTADFFRELTEVLENARDSRPGASVGERLLATCRAMRAWAVANPAEFGWIFASPIAAPNRKPDSARHRAGQHFERVFWDLFVELWETQAFPVPELKALPVSLRKQVRAYSVSAGGQLPPAAVHVFLSCWIRLYGLLCMEVMQQLDFAFSDLEPVFELCLRELVTGLGLDYSD